MLSVIIPVGRDEPLISKQIEEIKNTIGNVEYEIIIITIDKTVCKNIPEVRICLYSPANCAEARNYGARMAKGDIFVFSDAHTEYKDYGWGELIEDTFEQREDIGVATLPRYTITGDISSPKRYLNQIARGLKFNSDMNLLDVSYVTPLKDGEIPFIWGDFHVIRKDVFDDAGGYITEGWGHFEDRTMCVTCTLLGYKNICIEGKQVGAYIRPAQTSHISFPYWYYGNMCFQALHYTGERLERAKQFWIGDGHPEEVFDIVYDHWQHLRKYYLKRRVHDDNWYFETFLKRFG